MKSGQSEPLEIFLDHDGLIHDLQTPYNCEKKSNGEPQLFLSGQLDEFYLQNDFFEFDVDLLGMIPHMATVILVAKDQILASADIELREMALKSGQETLIRLHNSEKQILTIVKVSVHFSRYKFNSPISTAQNSLIDVNNFTKQN